MPLKGPVRPLETGKDTNATAPARGGGGDSPRGGVLAAAPGTGQCQRSGLAITDPHRPVKRLHAAAVLSGDEDEELQSRAARHSPVLLSGPGFCRCSRENPGWPTEEATTHVLRMQ